MGISQSEGGSKTGFFRKFVGKPFSLKLVPELEKSKIGENWAPVGEGGSGQYQKYIWKFNPIGLGSPKFRGGGQNLAVFGISRES